MSDLHLLPPNASPLERAMSLGIDSYSRTGAGVDRMHGIKLVDIPTSFLPYLVYEYGLGELSPYVPNLNQLIAEGVRWQRVRGTPKAIERAVGWLGYTQQLAEEDHRRVRWNLFMLELDRVRDDEADLPRIDGVANLSVPLRSYFWRGWHGYDVHPLDYSSTSYSESLYSDYSGARIPECNAQWSFGREHGAEAGIDYTMTEEELEALGVWLPDVESGDYFTWQHGPWPHAPWGSPTSLERSQMMIADCPSGPAWAVFKDADGQVIGYRRCLARHVVSQGGNGPYSINGSKHSPNAAGTSIYLEARTDWSDGNGHIAESVGFILGGGPTEDYPPGSYWLPPDGFDTPDAPVLCETPVSIHFGRTVRERVRALLRF